MSRAAPDTLTVHVPFTLRQRGGRKVMLMPNDTLDPRQQVDNTMVKALARAFRWKRMLESGEFTTIAELAAREGIAPSYLTRILSLTLLAPGIVESTLEGCQRSKLTLAAMMQPFPAMWYEQRVKFGYNSNFP